MGSNRVIDKWEKLFMKNEMSEPEPKDDEIEDLFDALIEENAMPIPHPDGSYNASKTASEIRNIIAIVDHKYDKILDSIGDEDTSDTIFDG